MKFLEAKREAQSLLTQIVPYCRRCEIVGSIRRRKLEVKDIEIVAIPRWDSGVILGSLFPEPTSINLLHQRAITSGIGWIKPGVAGIVPWSIKPEGKYWRGLLPSGIKLDLFLATPENWGIIFAIRTGSAEFTTALVTHAKQIGMPCVDGFLTRDGDRVPTPEEADVFDLLGIQFVAPQYRTGHHALRRLISHEGNN